MIEDLIRVAKRTEHIHYAVRDIIVLARQAQQAGTELLYLNIGDPGLFDFPTPPHIIEAICRALRDNLTSYAASEGLPAAIEAIREDAEQRCGIRAIQDIFVGSGCSECIEVALAALVDEGDGVLVPQPGYPLYSAVLAKLGAREQHYYLDEQRGWQPNVAELAQAIDARTRAIVLINPNNPTGSICDRATLEGILELAAKHNLVVLADEIYDRLVLDGQHIALGSLRDDVPVVTFMGLSKVYLGPGLRLGWAIVSGPTRPLAPYIDAMHKFLRARLSASHPVQHAVAPALRGDHTHLKQALTKLRARRELTLQLLNATPGIHCVPPAAAFYAFPRLLEETDDAGWVADLVRETGVVVVHGSGFGQRPGSAHFRVVYLPQEPTLRSAFTHIAEFAARRRQRRALAHGERPGPK